ncbi:MAG: hypothetical protein EP344_19415 [Bacteroidetes bacterium]|nr:MAG: hypothetical protein EP344_19415 [Bacteroidota bacterium]
MKIAIMQPYFFPYIGYFQLIHAVDKFVVFDDVNFIKKGWINRNRILVQQQPAMFTIPVKNVSQHRTIRDTALADDPKWKVKFLRTLEMAYKKAPCFGTIFPMLENLLAGQYTSIAELNLAGIRLVCSYLHIDTALIDSSSRYNNAQLKAQHRILDICRQEGAGTYVNAIGGQELYDLHYFAQHQVQLFFLSPEVTSYTQGGTEFHPYLSMLDTLMHLEAPAIRQKLGEFQLITGKTS